jgi:hypothetical protein
MKWRKSLEKPLTISENSDAFVVLVVVGGAELLSQMSHGTVVSKAMIAWMTVSWEGLRVALLPVAGIAGSASALSDLLAAASLDLLTSAIVVEKLRVALVGRTGCSLGGIGVRHAVRVFFWRTRNAEELLSGKIGDVAEVRIALETVGAICAASSCILNCRWAAAFDDSIGAVKNCHASFVLVNSPANLLLRCFSTLFTSTFVACQPVFRWENDSVAVVFGTSQATLVGHAAFGWIFDFIRAASQWFTFRVHPNITLGETFNDIWQTWNQTFKSLALVAHRSTTFDRSVAEISLALAAGDVWGIVADVSGFLWRISVAVSVDDLLVWTEEREASFVFNVLVANLVDTLTVAFIILTAFTWNSILWELFVVAVFAGAARTVRRLAHSGLQ